MRNYIIMAVALVVAFALGKYTNKSVETKTTTTDNKLVDTHQVEVITQVKKKDGTVQEIITTDTVQSTKEVKKTDADVIVKANPKWNVSAMAGEDISHLTTTPIYGVGVSHQFIGPINLGLFGFTNGLIGASIGITF